MKSRKVITGLVAGLAAFVPGFASAQAATVRPLWLGIEEPLLFGSKAAFQSEPGVDTAITGKAKSTGIRYMRVSLSWNELAHTEPADPTNPDDPAYDFSYADDAIRAVSADWDNSSTGLPAGAGLETLLVIEDAPRWAQEAGSPIPSASDCATKTELKNTEYCRYPGTWRPKPAALTALAQALATRYDGEHSNDINRLLPKVTHFQVWNEPNISTHLTPQRDRSGYVADDIYRGLLTAFRQGLVASGRADTVLVAAGLAPFGRTGSIRDGAAPQDFARAALCVGSKTTIVKKRVRKRVRKRIGSTRRWVWVWRTVRVPVKTPVRAAGCPNADFDIWAQHPYDIVGSPLREPDYDRRRGVIVDLPGFRGILDTATRLGTVTPAGRKPLWVTEFDWWTNPPNRLLGKPVATVARWTTLSLYKAWQAGAETLIWYRLRDHRFWPGGLWFSSADPSKVETAADLTTATLDADKPKSALANFRWPMLVSTGRRPFAWGIVPCRVEDVVVTVQKSVNRRWVNVATAISSPSGTFVVGLPTAGSGVGVWRAVVPEDCVAQSSSQAASPAWNTQG